MCEPLCVSRFDEYATGIQHIGLPNDYICVALQGLLHIVTDLSLLEVRLPELDPKAKATRLIQSTISHYVAACFTALGHQVVGVLVYIKKKMDESAQEGTPIESSGALFTLAAEGIVFIQEN